MRAEEILRQAVETAGHGRHCRRREYLSDRNATFAMHASGIRGKHRQEAFRAEYNEQTKHDLLSHPCNCWLSRAEEYFAGLRDA